jgi:hypothetical protein
MLDRVRRFLLFQAWIVWQGGFVFYAAVVIPVGTEVLGSPAAQGFVTQEVTNWLNVIGVAFHLLLAWNLAAERGTAFWTLRVGLGAFSALLLIALFALHPVLDSLLDPVERIVREPKLFYRWHIAYLWCSTVQWVLALVQAWLMKCCGRG